MSRRKPKVVHPTFPATPPRSMEPRKLREYQVEAADAVTTAHARGVEGPAVVLPTGAGKSHTHSTLVPTPNGIRKHGDLRVGDYVFHPSGKPVRVTGVYPQGVLPTWMMRFSDGSAAFCSGDHLWQVSRRKRKPVVMSTEELATTDLVDAKDNGAYTWRIPMSAPVQYPEADLPVEPYTLGALIANGHIPRRGGAAHLHLTTPDAEVHARVSKHYRARLWEFDEGCPYLSFPGENELMQSLTALRLRVRSGRKFIPEQYLHASVDQRIALLQGLMDGDGSSRAGGRRSVNYHTTAIRLARGVQRLVWSLGGTATRHAAFRADPVTGRPYTEYTLSILLPSAIEPFYSSRKKQTEKPRRIFEPHRSIVDIERAGHAECQCISVDAEDGLYLVGEEHIVTHNTTVIAELVRREVVNGRRVLLMAHRNELIEQMADAVVAVNPTGPLPAKIGGPHRGNPTAPVVSATVQSLQKDAALARIGMRDLVIVDEAHHAAAPTYRKVLEHFASLGGRRTGFTATMVRHAPTKGEPPLRTIWAEVVYERDVVWAIENGFLLAPEGVTVELPDLDVSALHQGSGDITDDEAESAMMRETTLNATVEAVLERTGNLSTIVFGASMAHCRQLAESLVELGVTAEVVVGPTTVRERTGIYNRFRSGETRVLVTVDVLTEGADFPRCEVVVLARPTRSQSRLIQQVGRALRPHTFEDGRVKERALVVDLVGAGSLGLIVETRLDAEHRDESESEDTGFGCMCPQPCTGEQCDYSCIGVGCACACSCAETPTGGSDIQPESTVPCTCTCTLAFGLCRCGCECDLHRVDPLQTFDPITGTTVASGKQRRGDSAWSTRTASIRWTRHPRGLVRPVYRQTGSKGVLMLADMRGVEGTTPGNDWAFGFYDTSVRRMFWVGTDGQWAEPGPQCYLQGMSLARADELAHELFPGHMRDADRGSASDAQVALARAIGVPDADQLDRRDLSDMIALAQADYWIPNFPRPAREAETAA